MTKKSDLQTFVPAHDFAGYPFGKKVDFRAGVESIPVPVEFIDLCRKGGHVAARKTAAATAE